VGSKKYLIKEEFFVALHLLTICKQGFDLASPLPKTLENLLKDSQQILLEEKLGTPRFRYLFQLAPTSLSLCRTNSLSWLRRKPIPIS